MVFFAETVRSELEELDYAEASVELNQGMIALEATQKPLRVLPEFHYLTCYE